MFQVLPVGALPQWLCLYEKRGREFLIDLVGTDPEQIVADNGHLFRGLQVLGERIACIPEYRDETWRQVDAYECENGEQSQ